MSSRGLGSICVWYFDYQIGTSSFENIQESTWGKPFTLTHCWNELKDCPKWKDLMASMKKGGTSVADDEPIFPNDGKRPRGRTSTKLEAKRDATTLALQETLKGFISQKDKAIEEKKEREEKKRWEREENAKNFFDLQKKKLEIDETNARSRAMEAEQALLAEESRIMMADLNTMTPRKRGWVEKKQKIFMERDV